MGFCQWNIENVISQKNKYQKSAINQSINWSKNLEAFVTMNSSNNCERTGGKDEDSNRNRRFFS